LGTALGVVLSCPLAAQTAVQVTIGPELVREHFGGPGFQLAEATMAAMNAGVYAMGYWTFIDYPDDKGGARGVAEGGYFHEGNPGQFSHVVPSAASHADNRRTDAVIGGRPRGHRTEQPGAAGQGCIGDEISPSDRHNSPPQFRIIGPD
jgi:hypothetical protein